MLYGFYGDRRQISRLRRRELNEIREGVKRKFGFTVNIGISENKLLAKMASDFEKPDQTHTLFPDEIRQKDVAASGQ